MDKSDSILPAGLQNLLIERRQTEQTESGDLGQAEFLKLMITQLENQDPRNPMESGEFLSQIAQFGTVNGITELQTSFSALASSLQSSQALQASTLVGREVAIAADTLVLEEGTPRTLAFELPSDTESVKATFSDAAGRTVRTQALGVKEQGFHDFEWNGLDDDGAALPSGVYRVNIEAAIDGNFEAVPTFLRAPVESVTVARDGTPPLLHLTEFGAVDFSAVKRVF